MISKVKKEIQQRFSEVERSTQRKMTLLAAEHIRISNMLEFIEDLSIEKVIGPKRNRWVRYAKFYIAGEGGITIMATLETAGDHDTISIAVLTSDSEVILVREDTLPYRPGDKQSDEFIIEVALDNYLVWLANEKFPAPV